MGYVELFQNPTKSEIEEVSWQTVEREIRWAADSETRDFYVWNCYGLHDRVFEILTGSKKYNPRVLSGIGEFKKGEFTTGLWGAPVISVYPEGSLDLLRKTDWSWVHTWLDITCITDWMKKL
jgi:hypothetical protein